jgi:chemotaxis signal transduction protein
MGYSLLLATLGAARMRADRPDGKIEMEVLLFTIDSHRYGVWKDQVSSVETVGAVHRLPFLRSSLTVLAVMGDHTNTLADLAPCLGHAPGKGNREATALVMSDQGQLRGFLVSAQLAVREIEPESAIALPDFLHIPFVESFLWMAGELVPVVAVRSLFDQVLTEGKVPESHSQAIAGLQATPPAQTAALKVVSTGASLLALQADELQEMPGKVMISRFPLLPPDLDGVAFFDDDILPVVDLGRRVSRRKLGDNPLLIGARVGNAAFGLLVENTLGEWDQPGISVMDLPFICRTRWSQKAAIHGSQAAAIIDLAELLSGSESPGSQDAFTQRYEPASPFPAAFGTEDVEVAEIRVLGRRLAVPKAEVVLTVSCVPIHAVPHAPGMIAGVAVFEGELLPVLDLARVLGANSQPTTQWRMIQLRNGSFQALVLSEKEPETRLLKPGIQRDVPVHLPYPVVYGCYTEGESIRLILNLHALALHFDESRAAEILPSLSLVEETREAEPRAEPATQGKAVEVHMEPAVPEEEPEVHVEPVVPEEVAEVHMEPVVPEEVAEVLVETVVQEEEAEVYVEALPEEETQPTASAVEGATTAESATGTVAAQAAPATEQPAAFEAPQFVNEDEIEIPLPGVAEEADTAAEIPSLSPEIELEPAPSAPSASPSASASPAPPAPLPSELLESAAVLEEERFVEEVHVRKQVVEDQPAHRGRRMLVAFVASALLIIVVIYGLYFFGLARGHAPAQAGGQQSASRQQSVSQQQPATSQPGTQEPAASQAPPTQPLPAASAPAPAASAAAPAASAPAPAALAPTSAPSPQSSSNPTYIVKQGDTLWDIAQRFTGNPLNYHDLAGQNLIKNPDLIFPGQVIQVDTTQKK